MIELISNFCFFYSFISFDIIEMQTNNIIFLASNIFDNTKKIEIRLAKIITKDKKHLIFTYLLKFNSAKIKLDLNGIVLIKKVI